GTGLDGLDRGPDLLPGGQPQLGGGGGGDVGRGGHQPGELDAQVVAVALDAGDGRGPGIARAALGFVGVQRDRGGRERDEHIALCAVRHCEGEVRADAYRPVVGVAPVEVEADEPGDVVGTGLGGDGGRVAFLDDVPVLDDDQAVGEHEGVERV